MKMTFNGETPFCLVSLAKSKNAKKGDVIATVSLNDLKRSANEQSHIQEKIQKLADSGNGTQMYILWEDDHNCYLDICNKDKVIDWTMMTIEMTNSYKAENFGWCFRENVDDIDFSSKALNSGEIVSYEAQYSTRVFKVEYIGDEKFVLYQLTDYIHGGFI